VLIEGKLPFIIAIKYYAMHRTTQIYVWYLRLYLYTSNQVGSCYNCCTTLKTMSNDTSQGRCAGRDDLSNQLLADCDQLLEGQNV